MIPTADWLRSVAPRDSVIAICRNVLTFRAAFVTNTHTRAYKEAVTPGHGTVRAIRSAGKTNIGVKRDFPR
jgi:hypothetical protein